MGSANSPVPPAGSGSTHPGRRALAGGQGGAQRGLVDYFAASRVDQDGVGFMSASRSA